MARGALKPLADLRLLGLAGIAGASSFFVVAGLLHVLRPDIAALDDYVSDFANGRYGLALSTAVVIHGLGNLALPPTRPTCPRKSALAR